MPKPLRQVLSFTRPKSLPIASFTELSPTNFLSLLRTSFRSSSSSMSDKVSYLGRAGGFDTASRASKVPSQSFAITFFSISCHSSSVTTCKTELAKSSNTFKSLLASLQDASSMSKDLVAATRVTSSASNSVSLLLELLQSSFQLAPAGLFSSEQTASRPKSCSSFSLVLFDTPCLISYSGFAFLLSSAKVWSLSMRGLKSLLRAIPGTTRPAKFL
mmetsp:Transcript_85138/g.150594  ORF Transcript_85138/g.150594 Transcript_85138/m.150594 type:complete len:216 (+) Transcript_85138:1478-2125(+)